MFVVAALLVVVLLAVASCSGGGARGDGEGGEPVIGVDAEGNLHINTTSSDTAVFVNGRAIEATENEDVPDLEEMVATLTLQHAALTSRVRRICKKHGLFSQQKNITISAEGAFAVSAADLDGDGDMDVLSASALDDTVAWYENEDGQGSFSAQRVIATSADYAVSIFPADLDGDGDVDVLSASRGDNKIAWYENEDGLGTFSAEKVITTNAGGARSVFAADVDGDNDIDVVSASYDDDKIAWYENEDGLGSFSQQNIITASADGALSVFAGDLDGDGDIDVLSASELDDKIAWYENEDGLGTFSAPRVITANADAAYSTFAADLDGDGDMDVLSSSYNDDKIAWYENEDGLGSFSQQKAITTNADGALSAIAGDVDGDGDIDVLSASELDKKIAWYENLDGKGTFSTQKVITTSAESAFSVFTADLDGDGDVDVLTASFFDDKIAWYENIC